MFAKTIDFSKCTSCMQCEAICTNSRVIIQNDSGRPEFRYDGKCIYCGHCLAICPEGAITFTPTDAVSTQENAYYAKTLEQNAGESPLNSNVVFNFLCAARSNRIFLNQTVEHEKLETVVDAMVRSASAGNEQNRNFYVISNPDTLGRLEQAIEAHFEKKLKAIRNPVSRALFLFFGALRAGRQNISALETSKMPLKKRYALMQAILRDALPKHGSAFSYLKQAPVLILITRGEKDSSMHKSFYRGDACIAATYGLLMAKALRLASCWMGLAEIAFSQNAQLGQLVKLKPGERVDAAVALGYSDLIWRRMPPRVRLKSHGCHKGSKL